MDAPMPFASLPLVFITADCRLRSPLGSLPGRTFSTLIAVTSIRRLHPYPNKFR